MRTTTRILAAGIAAFASAIAIAEGHRDWTPGAANPDWPHVVAGVAPETYEPEAGYKFVNNKQGDFSVVWSPGTAHPTISHIRAGETEGRWVPLVGWKFERDETGKNAVVPETQPEEVFAGDTEPPVRIPPPDGFIHISSVPKWNKVFGAMDAADNQTVTYGHWVDVDGQDTFWEALARCPRQFAESYSLQNFREGKRQMEKDSRLASDSFAQAKANAERGHSAIGKLEISDFETKGIHASDGRSYSFSHIRTQTEHRGTENVRAFTVGTSCSIWVRNKCVILMVLHSTSNPEAVEHTIAVTRKVVRVWKEAFYKANGLTGEIPNTEAFLALDVGNTLSQLYSDTEKGEGTQRGPGGKSKGGRDVVVVVCCLVTVAIAVIVLLIRGGCGKS